VIGVSPVPGVDVPQDHIPANVQTARSADIERAQALDLTNFMNRRLGSVFINEMQNNPFQPDVNFRGFTASPLLGTQQGLSLYMDGVRLNVPACVLRGMYRRIPALKLRCVQLPWRGKSSLSSMWRAQWTTAPGSQEASPNGPLAIRSNTRFTSLALNRCRHRPVRCLRHPLKFRS
jgi:hypothetical protein